MTSSNRVIVGWLVVAGLVLVLLGLWFTGGFKNIKFAPQAAAVSTALSSAGNFAVLASTYTNTVAGTTINGDLGYVTGPAAAPTVSGATHVNDATYAQAGVDQGNALSGLQAQACDFTFPSTTDLSLLAQPLVPGVYCIGAAASIGTGGITLSGAGTYIFRITGALTTVANSVVTLSGGASACDVFWTPTAATTLGANSTFVGTNIDDSGISVGSTVGWTGRALAFNGTVSTDADTITKPTCTTSSTATLHVIKTVINVNGGTAVPSDFSIHVKSATSTLDVSGSPVPGAGGLGTSYTLVQGATYNVSEAANALSYTQTFGGACAPSGSVTLAAGDNICTVVNTDVAPPAPVGGGGGSNIILPLIGLTKIPNPLALPSGPGPVTYTYTAKNIGTVPMIGVWVKDDTCSPLTYVSGDTNKNSELDINESWIYTCTQTLSKTTTNTATAHGSSHGYDAYATALATVVVGAPITPPLITITKVPSRLTPFPFGGGNVKYTYTVKNPGVVALSHVLVTDDKCITVSRISGDANSNNLLETNETWIYTCSAAVPVSTRNIATAAGTANGIVALGYAFATVLVATPGLPNTGFPPR